MRPSEIRGTATPMAEVTEEKLDHPRSEIADPAITVAEAKIAQDSICQLHNGLIRETGDVDGTVFLCPIGGMYWRYTKQESGMYASLPYGAEIIV